MLTGIGYGTGPGQIIWFCHICRWAGTTRMGEAHVCAKGH